MSVPQLVSVALLAPLFLSTMAAAAGLTNRDAMDHKVAILSGAAAETRVLKPQESWTGICPEGCVLRLNDSEADDYELEGSDEVSIEDGFLYYNDAADGAASTAPKKDDAPK